MSESIVRDIHVFNIEYIIFGCFVIVRPKSNCKFNAHKGISEIHFGVGLPCNIAASHLNV